MTSNMLHERFHRSTGIAFSSIYPGCIAESPLFREKRPWFRKYFPIFMKYVTGGYVGEEEAGQRLFQVLHDPRCTKSGVYWSWNGGPREGRGLETLEKGGQIVGSGGAGGGWDSIFENDQSDKVLNRDIMMKLWQYSTEVTSAKWPEAYQPKSPCPTLKVVGAATSFLGVLEEQARMKASRDGEGAAIVANRSLPTEERRRQLDRMLMALDKTPTDPEQVKQDYQRTSGQAPELSSFTGVDGDDEELALLKGPASKVQAAVPELDDPAQEDEEKGPPQMIPGHELLGDIPVVFQPQNVKTMAKIGQPLSDVASRADVFIRYKCRKGECKTCVVNIDGKWVSACQTKIPPIGPGQEFGVSVRPVSDAHKNKEKAAFFSPASVADGFMNNAIGMLGFATESVAADPDFSVRIGREKAIEKLAARKKEMAQANLRGKHTAKEYQGDSVKQIVPGLLALGSFMLVLLKQAA